MTLRLNGSTSGYTEIDAPAVGGNNIFQLPAGAPTVNNSVLVCGTGGAMAFADGPLAGTRNRIINGDMRIDQRNAGAAVTINTGADTYTLDRFIAGAFGGGAFTVQRSTTAPTGFTNSLLATVTTVDSSIAAGDFYSIHHRIEGNNVSDLCFGTASAKQFTVSFWVRSSVTGTYSLALGNNANNRWIIKTFSIAAANTFEYKTLTFTADTSGTWETGTSTGLWLWWSLGSGTTYQGTADAWTGSTILTTSAATNWISNSGATFYITGVQLEAGSVATPFERRSYGQELALCQRYYYAHVRGGSLNWGVGTYYSSTLIATHIYFPVSMRSTPALDYVPGTSYYGAFSLGTLDSFDAMGIARAQVNGAGIDTSTGTSGTAGAGCILQTSNANAFIAFTSEL